MRICLVNPRFPLSLWDFSLCRDLDGSDFSFPPLGLVTLAALTPAEHEVMIHDENVRPLDRDLDADIIGITGYAIQRDRVFELADRYRKLGHTVVLGGPVVQRHLMEQCLQHADAVFLGEAEYTWPRFLKDRAEGRSERQYVQETHVDLADSPLPRFDLVDLSSYAAAIIETSRGCPHACEFCEIPARLGKGSRTKTTAQVMAEVRDLAGRGVDSIFIIDDNFFGNRSRALDLIGELEQFVRSVRSPLYFSCQFTIDTARDEAVLELLERANFRRVFIGIETPRRTSLMQARKVQNTLMDLREAVRRVQSHNIIVWGAFIVGFDEDDPAVFQEQLDFIQQASIPVAMVGILQALPGTPLYERMRSEGRLRDDAAGGIRSDAESLMDTNIVPKRMRREELFDGYRTLVSSLYRPDAFAERLLAAVRMGTERAGSVRSRITPGALLVLLRIVRYYLLTRDLQRARMFLRVILSTLRHRPQQLYTVLLHLVVYKHLRQFYARATAGPLRPEKKNAGTS